MPSNPTFPQVNTPTGNLTIAVPPGELVPFLDRVLDEAIGRKEPPPVTVIIRRDLSPVPEPIRRPAKTERSPATREYDPNHHLWVNGRSWWIVYTIHPTPVTKERVRHSLSTRCLTTARIRRDEILASCVARGILAGPLPVDLGNTSGHPLPM